MRKLVTTLGLLLFAWGSAHAQGVVLQLPSQDQQNITAQLGSGVVGSALRAKLSRILPSTSLYKTRRNSSRSSPVLTPGPYRHSAFGRPGVRAEGKPGDFR